MSKSQSRFLIVVVFVGLTLLTPLLDLGIIHLHSPQLEQEAYANLQAIADLKVNRITHWLAERQADGELLAKSAGFTRNVNRFLHQSDDVRLHEDILDRLDGLHSVYSYEDILLLDATGRTAIRLSDHAQELVHLQPLLAQMRANGQIQRSDFYRDKSGNIYLDWVVPITLTGPDGDYLVAIIVLHADPQNFCFADSTLADCQPQCRVAAGAPRGRVGAIS